ncbi:MAG: sugar phosphate isomerase/epimerase [Planctomycetia bacterium]|nr:sugar phosphate isomerase/epimerase [Planctomycetia bacterium]
MDPTSPTRRAFLKQAALAGGAATLAFSGARHLAAAEVKTEEAPAVPTFKHPLHKAMMGAPTEAAFRTAKDNGFEAIETWQWDVTPDAAKKAREVADKVGVRIHSVIRAWVPFDHPDSKEVDKHVATVQRAVVAAANYGADDILLVSSLGPHGVKVIPEAWEFDIEMDDKGMVSRVVAGDNARFKPYIEAQNRATTASHEVMKRVTAVAEKVNVVVGLENVWNNLWVRPELFKKFVEGHNHPLVRPYFDCANHVKYGIPPETWIRVLGPSIIKVHIKEYRLSPDKKSGTWTRLRENGINWPEVRKALDEVGFESFGTIEDSGAKPGLPLADVTKRFDLIVAGK